MAKGFKILQTNPYEDTDKTIKNYYSNWREFNKGNADSKEKFAMLYTSFRDNYLPDIEGGALKLYLFFCFNANNNNGESWYSIEKIAKFLNVGTRTINKWIKVLMDKQLIYRDLTNHKSLTTYLLPYSTALMKADTKASYPEDTQAIVEDIISSLQIQEKVFGELTRVLHLFQWGSSKRRRRDSDKNVQWLLFITKRQNGILTGHYYELKNSENIVVSKRHIDESYFFNSAFRYQNNSVLGIALDNETDITTNAFEPMKELIEHLSKINRNSIDPNQFIEYRAIKDELELEIEDEI